MSSVPGVMPASCVGGDLLQAPSIRLADVETYRGFEDVGVAEPARLVITRAQVGGQTLRLARPVQVELSGAPGSWVAENAALELFGDGPSRASAIQAFSERFEHFLAYYLELSWDEVGGNGRRLKGLYGSIAGRDAGPNG